MVDPTLDWDALTEEATELLSAYLRIDTVNPPGNEHRACEWLGAILDREGVDYRLLDPGGGRTSLIATLESDGTRGAPLILLNHTDVVPFERDHWTADPLGGEVRDGVIWGRGALDMKGMGVMELIVFLLHRRHGLPLHRDLTFLAVADEETGSSQGVEYLANEHPDVLRCEYVINEGGRGSDDAYGTGRPVMQIGTAEKAPLWLRLRTTGQPGHGSVPTADNAADRLVAALERVRGWRRERTLTPELREHYDALYRARLLNEPPSDELVARHAEQSPRVESQLTNSIALTTLDAGVKHNVIPAEASATLDCRLLPGQDADAFVAELRAVIDDPRVEIEEVMRSGGPSSSTDTELYQVMTRAVQDVYEDAAVVPWLSTGFTDSRVFRAMGAHAYGFVPIFGPAGDEALVHGNDERISVEQLRTGMQILYATVRGICG